MKNAFIGTSGWSYSHWKKNFYPLELPTNKWLNYYSDFFSTVEINSTFYRLPSEKTIKNWHIQTPKEFQFSIKASQYITHRKRLNDCEESLTYLFGLIKPLKEKLGPILFQLPPNFQINRERFEEFIQYLPSDYRVVFEFRHPSWFVEDIYSVLEKNNIGLCLTDLNGKLSPQVITADFAYIRLHGPKKAYQGSYSPAQLRSWKTKITHWMHDLDVYCYFDNDEKGYAIKDALKLKQLITN